MLLPVREFEDIAAAASAFIGKPAPADAGDLTLRFLRRLPIEKSHDGEADDLPSTLEAVLVARVDG